MKTQTILILIIAIIFFTSFSCSTGESDDQRSFQNNDDVGYPEDDDSDDDTFNDDDSDDDDFDDDDDSDDDDYTDCVVPYDDMEIYEDTRLCPDDTPYAIDDLHEDGVIRIAGSNITVKGKGVTIDGDGKGIGIFLLNQNLDNVQIKGIHLSNFYRGIHGVGPFAGLTISGITVSDSRDMHINIESSPDSKSENTNIVLDSITASGSYNTGIACGGCFDSTMRNITSTNNRNAVIESNLILFGGGQNIIEDNLIQTSNSLGCNSIWIFESDENIIQNNTIENGYKDGSHMHGSSDNIFKNNTFTMLKSSQYLVWPADSQKFNDNEKQRLIARYGALKHLNPEKSKRQCMNNQFYANEFNNGIFYDFDAVNSQFCVDGQGNDYLNGAIYQGTDSNNGTCP